LPQRKRKQRKIEYRGQKVEGEYGGAKGHNKENTRGGENACSQATEENAPDRAQPSHGMADEISGMDKPIKPLAVDQTFEDGAPRSMRCGLQRLLILLAVWRPG